MNLNRLNLNNLKVLAVLLEERHVTRTGMRLGVTQAAVSSVLAKMRELFADELLVRTNQGMVPTDLALRLQPRLQQALQEMLCLITDNGHFDPKDFVGEVVIGLQDYVADLLLPQLEIILASQAPNIKLRIQQQNYLATADDLQSGKLHLAIGHYPTAPEHLKQQHLFNEQAVCLFHKNNPLVKSKLSLNTLKKSRIIMLAYKNDLNQSNLAEYFHKKGLDIKPTITLPFYSAGLSTLAAESDTIFIVPLKLAEKSCRTYPFKYQNLPFEVPLSRINQYWSFHIDNAKWHLWLRKQINNMV